MELTLEQASTIMDAALAKGREMGLTPLCVAVLDQGGHLKVLKREDKTGMLRVIIAIAKAWGAVGMGLGTRLFAQRSREASAFFATLSDMTQGKVVPVPGGVLIKSGSEIIGAVGISGASSDDDEACAIAGIKAAGLEADPG